MKIELLKEPTLEFGKDFICEDPKKGISIGGFFSIANKTHRSEVRLSIIGTKNNIQDFKDWLKRLDSEIEATAKKVKISNEAVIEDGEVNSVGESENPTLGQILELFADEESSKELDAEDKFVVNKKLNPDFIGFNQETAFACEFLNDELNNTEIKQSDIDQILNSNDTLLNQCMQTVSLYKDAFTRHNESLNTKPDICIIVIPSKVFEKLSSIPFGKRWINFRRKLKADLLTCESEIPVQLILEDTILHKKKQQQDDSMVAWNFSVAQYYKTDSIPWTLTDINPNTCFVGISFHKVLNQENNQMRSSIAQAFNREGKGLVFVGKQFLWDSDKTNISAPHLTYDYAKDLVQNVIKTFITQNKKLRPTRVVIHKTTDFWNSSINKDYCEIEGLKDGIRNVLGNDVEIDLVTIKHSPIKLFRFKGQYPVLRGTLLEIDKTEGVLYTTGFIPYYETFPGVHMPMGKSVSIFEGETTLRKVCEEILALTKMNFNNCNYYDSLPITLRFAQKVGEIIQYLPEGFVPPSKYYYYM